MKTDSTPPPSPYLDHYRAALREQKPDEDFDEALLRVAKRLDPEGYAVTFAAQCAELDAAGSDHRAAAVSLVGEPLPAAEPPAPVVVPNVPEVPDLNALAARPGVQVTRHVQASVSLDFPQAMVDKQGRLTPDQWARLMAAYDNALEEHMKAGMEQGRSVSLGAAAREVPLPFDQIGVKLPPAEQHAMQQAIVALIPDAAFAPDTSFVNEVVTSIASQRPGRPRASLSCGVLALGVPLLVCVAALLR
jgi:hypothetical protein